MNYAYIGPISQHGFATSRPVSYRSRIALYVVVVVSVMAAKRIRFKPRQWLFSFLCRCRVEQLYYTLVHTAVYK